MRAFAVLVGALLMALGCSRSSNAYGAAPRLVCIGSPVTETVFALGAGNDVVAVDTSSLYPAEATRLPQVGYQRTLSAEGILAARPSLVLATAEAGPPVVLEQLRAAGVRVDIVSAESTVNGARQRIVTIAEHLGRDPHHVLASLDADLERARVLVGTTHHRPKVLVLYARGSNALHVFGRATPADAMLALAGADNAITSFDGAKPLTPEALTIAAPDVIVVPSRGLESVGGIDALLRSPGMADTPAGKAKRIVAIDDLLLLGFGPRTGVGAVTLAEALHPELHAASR